jgi:DNA-binding LytR/AlgR family response regulator
MEKILIIEDEPELALNIKEILSLIGYEVVGILDNGKDVMEFLQVNSVDLIFMDIQIRGPIDGVELCKKIKTRFKIPVIYLTAFSNKSMLDKITTTEYEGYILKPFTLEDLQATTYLVLKNFPKTPRHSPKKNVMMVRDKGNAIPLQFDEILFLKADGLYTIIQTKTKSFVSRNILKDMIQGLPKNTFVRVHKSYTINYQEITSFNAKEIQIGEYSIPLRRGSLKEIKALIEFQSPDI